MNAFNVKGKMMTQCTCTYSAVGYCLHVGFHPTKCCINPDLIVEIDLPIVVVAYNIANNCEIIVNDYGCVYGYLVRNFALYKVLLFQNNN